MVAMVNSVPVVRMGVRFATMGHPHAQLWQDLDNGQIWWSMDGVWQINGGPGVSNGIFSNVSGTYHPSVNLPSVFNNTKATLCSIPESTAWPTCRISRMGIS